MWLLPIRQTTPIPCGMSADRKGRRRMVLNDVPTPTDEMLMPGGAAAWSLAAVGWGGGVGESTRALMRPARSIDVVTGDTRDDL
jgi:hypothetical protein